MFGFFYLKKKKKYTSNFVIATLRECLLNSEIDHVTLSTKFLFFPVML